MGVVCGNVCTFHRSTCVSVGESDGWCCVWKCVYITQKCMSLDLAHKNAPCWLGPCCLCMFGSFTSGATLDIIKRCCMLCTTYGNVRYKVPESKSASL